MKLQLPKAGDIWINVYDETAKINSIPISKGLMNFSWLYELRKHNEQSKHFYYSFLTVCKWKLFSRTR